MNFNSRLKQIRESRMLSTSKLSKLSGLSQPFICRIESGEKQPTLETLRKLSQGLGISLGELLGEPLLSEPESPQINRIITNLRKLPTEQIEALDLFVASLSAGYASGETPLTVQAINFNDSDNEEFEIEIVFSANVSAVLEHRIPDGTQRNMAGFHMYDDKGKEVSIQVIPGSQRLFGRKAERTFIIKPQKQLENKKAYRLEISKLLQANNYKYLQENHTILFSTHGIINITPYNKKLCSPYLALTLESSSISQGDENIPVNASIKLIFSNNVITKSVREHNQQCFSLKDSKDRPVDIDIIMADPEDSSTRKKEIIIQPKEFLSSNTVYILTISDSLQGGNQKLLGTDKIITFTTGETRLAEFRLPEKSSKKSS